jgi:hypothetical protein
VQSLGGLFLPQLVHHVIVIPLLSVSSWQQWAACVNVVLHDIGLLLSANTFDLAYELHNNAIANNDISTRFIEMFKLCLLNSLPLYDYYLSFT